MIAATAEQVIAALDAINWPLGNAAPWGVEGVDIPGTDSYVNSIDTHVEGDYQQWYLVEVCDRDHEATEHYFHSPDDYKITGIYPSTRGETWRRYLAVWQHPPYRGPVEEHSIWEWHFAAPHRFFDLDTVPILRVRHWFIDWIYLERDRREVAELGY